MRRIMPLAALLAASSCAVIPGGPSDEGPALTGTVSFGESRSVQATMTEVGVSATVSLISATTNKSLYTTLTDETGKFILTLPGWKPDPTELYYLEAYKGLGDNRAGNSAVRVRTIGRYTPSGWTSITSSSPGTPIWLTTSTTTVSIIASHLGAGAVPPAGLIGKISVGIPDSSLAPMTPDTLAAGTGISNAHFHLVYGLVSQTLSSDGDPFASIQYDGTTFSMKTSTTPTLSTAIPMAAPIGAAITLYGSNFATTPAGNTVSFNGTTAVPDTASANRLTVTVPAGATSGPITVTTSQGSTQIPGFTLIPDPSGSLSAN